MKVIHWGIIGAGKIADKFATDLATVEGAKLHGIASRSLKKAEAFAVKHKAVKAYGNYGDLVKDTTVDAVYIATPHSFHKAHSILCLENRKAVLCEKPFAMNLGEVKAMIEASKANNTLLMEAMWTVFLPHFQKALQLLKDEYYGKILKLEADFGFHPVYDENSRLFKKELGGGSLLDIGIYPVFAALSSMGIPNKIEARANFFDNDVDSKCNIRFRYKNTEAILKSTFLEVTETEAIFYCEEGTIKMNSRFHEPSSLTLIDKNGKSEYIAFNYKTMGYSYEIEHFNDLIKDGKTESDIMTFAKSCELITTLDRIRAIIGLDYS